MTAHDLRNIINGIYGLNQLVTDKLNGHLDTEIKQLLDLISKQCETGIELTTGLVYSYQQSYFSVNKLLKELQKIHCYRANKKNIQLAITLPDKEIYIQTARSKLIRVLDNLLDNAVKFTPREGKVSINLAQKENKAIITISDTGIGIPNSFNSVIFDKQPQIQRTGTENEPSTGLGLYISKQLIDELNGKIWFDSKENIGTTFYLSLETTEQ